MGCSTSARTAGLTAAIALPPPAIDRSHHAKRLDLDLDPAGSRVLIIAPHVAMGEMVDVIAAGILGPVDHATQHLRPAPHGLGVDQQQADPRIALQMLEPPAIRATVDPEGPILELKPDRDHLDAAVLSGGADDGRIDLLGEFLHLGTEFDPHQATSHLNSRVASTRVITSQTARPANSPRTAHKLAPSRLMLRRAFARKVSGSTFVIGCNQAGLLESEKKTPERDIIGNEIRLAIAATGPSYLANPQMVKPNALYIPEPMQPTDIR